ncbi:hypothetical protein ACTXT7_016499 [Hymenolepis weldensis]
MVNLTRDSAFIDSDNTLMHLVLKVNRPHLVHAAEADNSLNSVLSTSFGVNSAERLGIKKAVATGLPHKRVPGSLWGGKQRKIPRLIAARKTVFTDEVLVTQQNDSYLSEPYISSEAESMTLSDEQVNALEIENEAFYKIYEEKFRKRFPDRKLDEFWLALKRNKIFSV